MLPHLKPGFSVQFAFLDGGLDPDDFIRQKGAPDFEKLLSSKRRPLFDVLLMKEDEQAGP